MVVVSGDIYGLQSSIDTYLTVNSLKGYRDDGSVRKYFFDMFEREELGRKEKYISDPKKLEESILIRYEEDCEPELIGEEVDADDLDLSTLSWGSTESNVIEESENTETRFIGEDEDEIDLEIRQYADSKEDSWISYDEEEVSELEEDTVEESNFEDEEGVWLDDDIIEDESNTDDEENIWLEYEEFEDTEDGEYDASGDIENKELVDDWVNEEDKELSEEVVSESGGIEDSKEIEDEIDSIDSFFDGLLHDSSSVKKDEVIFEPDKTLVKDIPKDLREFIKQNKDSCSLDVVYQYFSKKEVSIELKKGRVSKRNNKLFI